MSKVSEVSEKIEQVVGEPEVSHTNHNSLYGLTQEEVEISN